jgi:hypothetical protein
MPKSPAEAPVPGLEAIIQGLMTGGQPTGALAGALMPLMRGLSGQLDSTQTGFTPFMFKTLSALSRPSGIGLTANAQPPFPPTASPTTFTSAGGPGKPSG